MVKFLLGVLSGGLLVTGGLVVSSMLFPTDHANDNAGVTPAVETSMSAPAPKAADTEATGDAAQPVAEDKTAAASEATPAPADAASSRPEPAAPVTETAATDPAPAEAATDTATDTAADTAEAASPTPEVQDKTTAAEGSAEPKPAATATDATASGGDTASAAEPAPKVDTPVPAPAAEKPVVADALPAPAAPQAEAALADAGTPAATEVTTPETAAEPSKPAETVADAAATPPDPAPTVAPAEPAAGATAETAPSEPAPATETATAETATPDAAPAESATTEPAPAATEVAEAAPAVTQPITETPAATAPATEPAPAPDAAAEEPAPAEEAPAVQAPAPAPEVVPAAPEEAKPEVKLADATPGKDVPDMPGKKPEGLPEASTEMTAPEAPGAESDGPVFKPAPGLTAKDDGVVIKRGNQAEPAPADSEAAALPPADTRPIVAYAAKFENPDAKPPFAIVLIDDGRADLDRAGLASLPLPVSIALDPMDPATPDRAAAYRAAGKEVVMLVTGIAEGAQASDVEVAFQSMAQGLPEAVAAMDLAQPTFQNNRVLASAVVPILKAQGRGLLTWDAGLNAADQVARREDLEAAVVFRDLDQAKGDRTGLRRLLDRAVFKAGQEGRVAVVATADADTLTGLLEWSVEGKAATVAVAPLTAVLKVD